ncbi:hypothetical protein ACGFXC_27435 [Streptomyces sp. NPDC048507]|uniref:hypothetical protein n=1 Tax=Streptomyces sp. NPDC048507 TaxID=3365560 RepID=UPI0037158A15
MLTAAAIAVLAASGCTPPASSSTASDGVRAAPLTTEQLKDAALVDADVPQVQSPMTVTEPDGRPSEFPPVADPVCRTYVEGHSGEHSFARVYQSYDWSRPRPSGTRR